VLGIALALLPAVARAQEPGDSLPSDEETPTLVASRPAAVTTPVAEDRPAAPGFQLAPVGFGDVGFDGIVPADRFADVTPPPPKLAAFAASAGFVGRPASLAVNSGFGVRRDPFTGAARMHTGLDLKASYGQRVGASLGGMVVYAGRRGGYGNLVVVDHGRGIATMYGHLSAISVAVGERVLTGQTVGLVGSSGRSTGPHLHYEVRARGRALDPGAVITFEGGGVYANGRLVDGPIVEGGDERVAKLKPGEKPPAPLPLPLVETEDSLSN
jgi:murein DD-endopeptidase MepM/ murein hydrolase activator NlpD